MININDQWPPEASSLIVKKTNGTKTEAHRYGWMWYIDKKLHILDSKKEIQNLITHWMLKE